MKKFFKIVGIIFLILIVIGIIGSLFDGNKKDTKTNSSITNDSDEVDTIVTRTENTKDAQSNWEYSEDVDKMTSKKIFYASINANEELQFEFPYNGGSVASLTIRKKDGVNDIYLRVTKGQFNNNIDGGFVRIKFDQKNPKRYSFSTASDGSSDIIFLNSTKDIISKLKLSKTIIIEAEFFNEGFRQIEFNTNGFVWNK